MGRKGDSKRKAKKVTPVSKAEASGKKPTVETLVKNNETSPTRAGAIASVESTKKNKKGK
jgi:hypothetical protein